MIPQSPSEAGELARREKLNEKLRTLAAWCLARAEGQHDVDTTLTMLDKKACEARSAVVCAGHDAFCKWTQAREAKPSVFILPNDRGETRRPEGPELSPPNC